MKQSRSKRIFIFLVVFALIIGMNGPFVAAKEVDEFSVVVSIEGLTLGQGIYVKPTEYTLSEINALVAEEGYGPFTEDNLSAAMATLALVKDYNLEIRNTGNWEKNFYLSAIKDIDTGVVDIPQVIADNGGPSNSDNTGNKDEWLGEFDYSGMSGWMITVNDSMINKGAADYLFSEAKPDYANNTYVVRWHFTLYGFGSDLGFSSWGSDPMFEHVNKDVIYTEYARSNDNNAKSSALKAMENLTASQEDVDNALSLLQETPGKTPQDVSLVLNEALDALADNVTDPAFGSVGGEWAVIDLARSGHYVTDDQYFQSYYERIVETVNELAAEVDSPVGALNNRKSTDNSRLIMALSAIGKNSKLVGQWNLIEPFNDFDWIKWQGINGPIFALIALDTHNYETSDSSIRQQCVNFILDKQLADGGWNLFGTSSDVDITAMALQALYNYKDQADVAAATAKAFDWLSEAQTDTGGYGSWGTENVESIAQVAVTCGIWGINPDTDSRFIKNDKSVIDAILGFYDADSKKFCHTKGDGGDAMASEQAIYGLVSYNRLLNGLNSLYDMSDVTLEEVGESTTDQLVATLGLPAEVKNTVGNTFNANVFINKWDNEGNYKLIDLIVAVPKGLKIKSLTSSDRLSGGKLGYELEEESGKLRVAYFDPNEYNSLSVSGTNYPAQLFQISFEVVDLTDLEEIDLAITGMSVKRSSKEEDMLVVNTDEASGTIKLVDDGGEEPGTGISFSAVTLYQGDDVDLIPSTKKAVAVAVTGLQARTKLVFSDGGMQSEFLYSPEISEVTGISTYVYLGDAALSMEKLVDKDNYVIYKNVAAKEILFGDSNEDKVINAQDALAVVDHWLRKTTGPSDTEILHLNVTGDSRINTLDALAIVEAFVNNSTYEVVMKAAILGTNP